ncbi:regulator of G-protein signaling loco-like [Stegodyphus dumicola]|uniref:regulator of G-protein signaling loco-like n=1 Tax=Stegodyphus dumicola TaxID=202533 RepID=UPI0015AA654C|nr:regulator of G-protein signaling loco-like [Stegodyphus dumicola]
MAQMAKEIYTKHLCIGAYEPVNVDSHARQVAQEGLDSPTPELFLPAQKQIFNLMKFDCYQRFLKSTMFKECMLREMQGQPLLYPGQVLESGNSCESDKQKVSVELKKRKSLIPWHKLSKTKSNESKNGGGRLWDRHCEIRKSLKKKKKEKESQKLDDTSSTQSDMTDSRSSLTSSETGVGMLYKNVSSRESLNSAELTLFPSHCGSDGYYCRVILPDLSTTVVKTQKGETVGEMLLKLLERRSLTYNAVEAYVVGSHQPLDHGTDVTTLSCKEIRVEQVILFCIDLPNKKTIGVKAKNNKVCGDILKPVLHKYGYKMDHVTMTVASLQKPVVKSAPITSIDNQRILIEVKDSFSSASGMSEYLNDKDKLPENDMKSTHSFPDLEELTNQIFDDLLKTRPEFQFDGLGVIDIERKCDAKKNPVSKSSYFYHHARSQIDIDRAALKCKLQPIARSEGMKSLVENKALLPHNPSRVINVYPGDSSCLQCVKNQTSESKFEMGTKDSSHGKENCPVPTKIEMKSSLPFNSTDADFGLSTALQSLDHNLSPELVYSPNQLAEKYFPRACYSTNEFEETHSEKFLQNLGIVPSVVGNLKSRSGAWPVSKPTVSALSHPPPRLPPRVRPTEHKDAVLLSANSSPTSNLDSTLTANDSFELDLDIDVTLRAHSDESLSPSRIGYLLEASNQGEDLPLERDVSKEASFSQLPLRRLSCEPPPVPPKALARGPPPRPPSRQLVHINPAFCLTSDEEASEDGESVENSANIGSFQPKTDYLDLGKDYGEFNISFV